MKDFTTPPDHVNFLAKKLFHGMGEIVDGAIAYLEPGGGGPLELHTHEHSHLFIVVEGEAKAMMDGKEVIIRKNESLLVNGEIPHSVWNNSQGATVMVGISVKPHPKH